MKKVLLLIIALIVAVIIVFSVKRAESSETAIVFHSPASISHKTESKVRPVAEPKKPHEEMAEILEKIPTRESLKKTGDFELDAHRSPVELAEAAEVIADIRDHADKDSHFVSEAMWFFDQCAMKEKVLSSIGSVCLHHLRQLSKKNSIEIDLKRFPKKLVQMSDTLTFAE